MQSMGDDKYVCKIDYKYDLKLEYNCFIKVNTHTIYLNSNLTKVLVFSSFTNCRNTYLIE